MTPDPPTQAERPAFVPARTQRMNNLWQHPVCRHAQAGPTNPDAPCGRPDCDEYTGPAVHWLKLFVAVDDSETYGPLVQDFPTPARGRSLGGSR